MATRKPKGVIAVTPAGKITMDHIIGFYALFSVPDKPVSATKLARQWAAEGLPADVVPNTRKAVHGFQVACRSVETRRTDLGSTRTQEIKVDEVVDGKDFCVYQLTRLVRKKADETIDFEKSVKVIFNKNDEDISGKALGKTKADELDYLVEAIRNHYNANAKKVPGARVRAAIRALMREVGAYNVRKKAGGVYFCPKDAKTYLDGLSTVLEALYGDDAELHLIFCADAKAEKKMVERHFTMEVSSEVDELMAEVTEALTGKGRKLRADRVGNILSQRAVLGQHKDKYSELLNSKLGEVKTKLELLDEQLEALVMAQGGE